LPTKTCHRHLETRAANVWDLVQIDQSGVDIRGREWSGRLKLHFFRDAAGCTRLFGLAVSVTGHFSLAVSVWDISIATFLCIN